MYEEKEESGCGGARADEVQEESAVIERKRQEGRSAKKGCAVEGCEKKHHAHGYCGQHAHRFIRHGNPLVGRMGNNSPTSDRIEAYILRLVDVPCHFWMGAVKSAGPHYSAGYPELHMENGVRLAHRLAYEEFIGPIPEGYEVDHLCRFRGCMNYMEHMEPVTPEENKRRARTTHCPQGHEYNPVNTYYYPTTNGNGYPVVHRTCRVCARGRKR